MTVPLPHNQQPSAKLHGEALRIDQREEITEHSTKTYQLASSPNLEEALLMLVRRPKEFNRIAEAHDVRSSAVMLA
jgi:hypothetical protein